MEELDALVAALAARVKAQLEVELNEFEERAAKTLAIMDAPEGYTDVEGAAKYLGRTKQGIRELVRKKRIPYYKIDEKVQFKIKELEAYIQGARVMPYSEVQ